MANISQNGHTIDTPFPTRQVCVCGTISKKMTTVQEAVSSTNSFVLFFTTQTKF